MPYSMFESLARVNERIIFEPKSLIVWLQYILLLTLESVFFFFFFFSNIDILLGVLLYRLSYSFAAQSTN